MASLEVLNSLCFMCFKPAPKNLSRNNVDFSETKFLLLLSRHLNIHSNSQNVTDQFFCCEDCSLLGKNFCDLLFQLEYLKLQLNWKLQRISDTMVCAGRVPSRFSAFRKQFEEEQVGGEVNHPVFLEIQEMRRNLIKQCTLKLKSSQPKVRLQRLPNMMNKETGLQVKTEKVSPKKLNKIPPSSSRHPQVGKFDLMAALVSYVAVLHLSLPLHPTLISKPDHEKCRDELEDLMSIDSSDSLVSCDDTDDVEEKNQHEYISTSLQDDNIYECESDKGFEGNEMSPETVASSLNESEGVATGNMNDDDVNENWIVTIKRETETVELGTEAEEKLKKQSEKRQNSFQILDTEDLNMNVNSSSTLEERETFPQTENDNFGSTLNPEIPLQADEGQNPSIKSLRPLLKCPKCPRTFTNQTSMNLHANFHEEILTPNEHYDTAEGENLTGEEKMDEDFEQEVNDEKHSVKVMMEGCESEVDSSTSSSQDSSEDESRLDSDDNILKGRGRPRLHPFQKVTKLATPRKKDIPPTECEVCQAKFSCEAAVEKHRVLDHKLDKYRRCHPCGKMFKCHRSLRNHRKSVKQCFPKNPNDLKPAAASLFPFFNEVAGTKFCPEEGCYEVFQYDEGLNVHLKTHGNWRCNFCPAEFSKAHDFADHELSEHKNEAVQNTSYFKTHARNMVGVFRQKVEQNPLACTRCDMKYQGKRTLVEHFLFKHLDIYTKPELNLSNFRRQCHICKKPLAPSATEKMMKRHIKSQHGVEGMDPSAIARCTICEAPFTLRLHLTNHMLLVHNQSAYKCPHCDKQFRIQGKLSQHLQNAHNGKPSGLSGAFQCEICNERFQAEYLLKIHSVRHKEKQDEGIIYKCESCPRTFSKKHNLQYHTNYMHKPAKKTEILTPNEHDDTAEGENLTGEEKMDGDFEQEVNNEEHSDAEMMECCESEVESSSSSSQNSSEDESRLDSDDNILRGRGRPRLHPFQKVTKLATPRKKDIPPTECEVCQATFSCEAAVEKHRVVDHKLDKYRRCHPCGKMFKCHRSLRNHRKTVKECFPKNPNDLKPAAASLFPFFNEVAGTKFCPEEGCYEVFQYDEGLNVHLKTHGNWRCNFCPAEFNKAHDFASHELSEHTNEAAQSTSFLKTHAKNMVGVVRQKVEQNPLACTRCDLRYQGRRTLVEHFLLKHLDISTKPELNLSKFRRQCHICKKTFAPSTTQKMMKNHIKSEHDVEGMDPSAIARCTICEAPFTLRLHLTNHMLLVHNQLAYKCPHCNKLFRIQGKLSQHLQNAHKGKPSGLSGAFQCEICKERFQAEYLLKIHSLRHKKIPDESIIFKCESCPRTFSKKQNLQGHVNYMHKPVKKTWHCDQCEKVFKTQTKLLQHTSYKHTDPSEWKFQCPEKECGKKCWSKQKLAEHIRTHTKECLFVCDFCGQGYRYRQYLRTHLAKVHGPSAAKTLPTQRYTKPFDQELNEKRVTESDGADCELAAESSAKQ